MSWTQGRPPQQQQGLPPQPMQLGGVPQTGSTSFSGNNNNNMQQQQQQQSSYHLQQQWNQANQVPNPVQNTWYSANNNTGANNTLSQGSIKNHQRQDPQNWQQFNLHTSSVGPPQGTQNYFMKPQDNLQQQQQEPPDALDNFFQQQQPQLQQMNQQPPLGNAQQQQQYYHQQQQNTQQPPFPVMNSQPQSLSLDSMSAPVSIETSFDNSQSNDGWGDWDWNDNPAVSAPNSENKFNNLTNDGNRNVIEESFNVEPNDNWQWSAAAGNENITKTTDNPRSLQQEEQFRKGVSQPLNISGTNAFQQMPKAIENLDNQQQPSFAKQLESTSIGAVQAMQSSISYNTQQVTAQTAKSLSGNLSGSTKPIQKNQIPLTQESSTENIQNPLIDAAFPPISKTKESSLSNSVSTPQQSKSQDSSIGGSPVYVSQAKPVSQPARQYATNPSVTSSDLSTNSPLNSLTSLGQGTSANKTTVPSLNASQQLPVTPVPLPIASQSPGIGNSLPSLPQSQVASNSTSLPPPPPLSALSSSSSNNPFKRTGLGQHHRGIVPTTKQTSNIAPSQLMTISAGSLPPPPEELQLPPPLPQNQEYLAPENSEVIDRSVEVENQEIAPNNDRNQYLQTSHLSEEGYRNNRQNINESAQDQNNENDNFPPPGLSRFVLGQPEADSQSNNANQPEIPPGLDRMVPGTELNMSDLNMERQADGQDTIPSPRAAYTNVPPVEDNDSSTNIDITADRNLYHVPGDVAHTQRVVTGVENGVLINQGQELRDINLDGENLEDQQHQLPQLSQLHQQNQQQHYEHESEITRDEPIEGANTSDVIQTLNNTQETESSLTLDMRDNASNVSTGNDESDRERDRHNVYAAKSRKVVDDKKRRGDETTGKRKGHYDSEESDYLSSELERRKYREGSVRNDRESRASKERDRRDKRDSRERDRYRDERDRDGRRYDRDRQRDRHEKDRSERGRYNSSRYDVDSKYETETSMKYERRRDRDRDRDLDRNREHDRERGRDSDYRRDEKDRRYKRDKYDRDDRDYDRDRRRDRDYREDRNDRRYRGGDRGSDREYRDKNRADFEDDYRKGGSSRNASDREKDRLREKDPRYSSLYGYPSGYPYDAYAYYQQQQQYYEQLRRTNPQAYAEWYRKYYAQFQQQQKQQQSDVMSATDVRESVHSGRSSTNNNIEKDRYNAQAVRQYIQQQIPYVDYYRKNTPREGSVGGESAGAGGTTSMNLLNSTLMSEKSCSNLSNAPSVGNLSQNNVNYILPLGGGLGGAAGVAGAGGYLVGYSSGISGIGVGNSGAGSSRSRPYYSYARSEYSETRPDNLSLNLIDGASSTTQEPLRTTPCKFTNDHSTVSLSAGLMVCVKPKYSTIGLINVVKLMKIGANDGTKKMFQSFPGPLVRGLTHKKTIIEFCEDQIRLGPPSGNLKSRQNSINSICSIGQHANKASFTLMWNLLILLLRQNGMVVGTDIAELLMKNKNQFPYELGTARKQLITSSRRNSLQSIDGGSSDGNARKTKESTPLNDEVNDQESLEGRNLSDEMDSKKSSLSEEEITEKFRNYLLYGNVNEALDWATDNNLWGHALFLASKVDRRSHANVMMKFANKLALNDPLQTLYQLMSGRTPSSVTFVQDEKWGDWRPHLAMILSNTSQKPELDRKAITTLGDSLYNRGDLFGAQFCYLMAQVGFGKYAAVNRESSLIPNTSNAIRLILLGASQHKQFKEFATSEAIMMTEIYEYACSLNDEKFSIVEFQPYKYLLALRMLDYGFQLKTLMYMEQIALHIQRDPSKYESTFMEKVYNLADRLKYYDPVLEKTMDDQQNLESDPSWSNQEQQGGNLEEQKWLQDLRKVVNEYCTGYLSQTQNSIGKPSYSAPNETGTTNKALIDQQFTEINQQFSELTLQYNNFDPIQTTQYSGQNVAGELQQQQQPQPQQQQSQIFQPDQQQPYIQNQNNLNETQEPTSDQYSGQYYQQNSGQIYNSGSDIYGSKTGYYSQQQQDNQQHQQEQPSYWSQQPQDEPLRSAISLPHSTSNKSGFFDDSSNDDGLRNRKLSENQHSSDQNKKSATTLSGSGKLADGKSQNKSSSNSNANTGWFGGIWNKFSLKPKNQMILPDDKNPTIVWNPETKRWINTEEDEAGQESFKPPPKMSELTPLSQVQPPQHSPPIQQTTQFQSQPPMQQQQFQQQQQQQEQQQNSYDMPEMNHNYNQQLIQTPQQQPSQMGVDPQSQLSFNNNPSPAVAINPLSAGSNAISTNGCTAPSANENSTKTPSLQSNMFKMQRNRTLKKSYVDVFNPSGAPISKAAETVLAPALPPAVPQGGFFIPSSVPSNDVSQQSQQQPEGAPQFYNPNQFSG